MKKPVIVLSSQSMPMEEPFRQNYHYSNAFNTDAIRRAGGLPVIPSFVTLEEAEALLERADGLFLTGGDDISPALYGEAPHPACETPNPGRDQSDYCLLEAALKLKKPILCICRGFQLTNVYLGGDLYQDVPTQYETTIDHPVYTYPAYEREDVHTVELVPGTPLAALLGEGTIGVNSLHHQAVRRLAEPLRPMAFAPDGLVESWYLPADDQWLWGIQWHPEMMKNSPRADAIFKAFLTACGLE